MTFTDNQTWFTILLVTHVFFAIAGIGPSFAFSILGPYAAKNPEAGLHVTRLMIKIEKAMVGPAGWVVMPVSGLLLILNRSAIRSNFFKEEWLIIAIAAFAVVYVLSLLNYKIVHEMEAKIVGGQAGTPEFGGLAKKAATYGQTMTVLTVLIAIMMIWKPLSECAGPLMRC